LLHTARAETAAAVAAVHDAGHWLYVTTRTTQNMNAPSNYPPR